MFMIIEGSQTFYRSASMGEIPTMEEGDMQSIHSKATKKFQHHSKWSSAPRCVHESHPWLTQGRECEYWLFSIVFIISIIHEFSDFKFQGRRMWWNGWWSFIHAFHRITGSGAQRCSVSMQKWYIVVIWIFLVIACLSPLAATEKNYAKMQQIESQTSTRLRVRNASSIV